MVVGEVSKFGLLVDSLSQVQHISICILVLHPSRAVGEGKFLAGEKCALLTMANTEGSQ